MQGSHDSRSSSLREFIMDLSDDCDGTTLVPYTSDHMTDEASDASTGRSESFQNGDEVKLSIATFGEVGGGIVVDASPEGHWLGVDISLEPVSMILVRPHSIVEEAQNVPLSPSQRGISSLVESIDRTVLWISNCVRKSRGDPPINLAPFVPQKDWIGCEVHLRNPEGICEASGRINCWKPEDNFQSGTLGDGYVGVTVLDVFLGNKEALMTHARWPISSCWFPSGRSLEETITYFATIPVPVDPLAYLGGVKKAPYRFIVRKRSVGSKETLAARKTSDAEVRRVSSARCCSKLCCQFFPWEQTLKIRQRFYAKSFEDRREYGLAACDQIHKLDVVGKKKVFTLGGAEVCIPGWYIIHGISKSTYHAYSIMFQGGAVAGFHGNKGVKRPRIGTVQVAGTMRAIINENADQMPHQMRSIGHGRMDTRKLLPSAYNWKRVRTEANELNSDYGLPSVSQSTVSRIKKELFKNVSIKPVGSSFAKCTTCDSLQEFISKSPKGSPEYVDFMRKRTEHLNHQASCRRLYASWREESKRNPEEILCIIHDKMDTAKTALPRMRVTTKATHGLGQFPMSLTGMVAHGHADGAYAHFAPSCWPGDSNFTISSLAKLLRRLEGPPIRETGDLFPYPPANPLFEALLRGKSRCLDALTLEEPSRGRGSRPLPKYLYLQLDNSAKDNKNQYLMAFLSLLTARGVFKEIQVGFLLVGHTHEDIDSYFGHLSTALKSKNTYVLADLMKAFMESQDPSFMPELIQEVADFKSFVKDYQKGGTARLIGLGEMHLFKFYVDNDGVPVMRYKKSSVDTHWLPSDKTSLRLWKKDSSGRPMLPPGYPKPVPFKPVWGSEVPSETGNREKALETARKATVNKNFILAGLDKLIQFWQSGMSQCSGYARNFGPYQEYWKRVVDELRKPVPDCPPELVEGFWPKHNWRRTPEESFVVNPVDVIPEEEDPEPYCGPANEAPRESFNPWRDIRPGSWVLLRPEDPSICAVWQGRALSQVCLESGVENCGKFLLQYWRPDNSEATLELMYRNCWYGKWVVEDTPPSWVDANSVVYSNWSKIVDPKSRTIPKKSREAAMVNLIRANEVDP